VLTEFTSKLGVHLQKGARRLMREIVVMPRKPATLTICCLGPASKQVYLHELKHNYKELVQSLTFVTSEDSEYY
jgi:hypothetical protein